MATKTDNPRFDPEPVRQVLSQLLEGGTRWQEFIKEAIALREKIAHEEYDELDARAGGAAITKRSSQHSQPSTQPLNVRDEQIRGIIGGLEENVQWYLGSYSSGEETDERFFKEELREVAKRWLRELDNLDALGPSNGAA